MTFEEMSVMAVTKSFYIEIAFVTAIGDIFTHVTAIGDPWVSNGCDKSAHTIVDDILETSFCVTFYWTFSLVRTKKSYFRLFYVFFIIILI